MKIIDYGYLIPSAIVILGIPLLMIIKLSQHSTNPLDITIYGSTIQTALLAYYIDKRVQTIYGQQGKKYVNVTIISPFDPPVSQREIKQIQKTLLSFCGVQGHLLGLLKQLDMQFQINQYGIYFAHLSPQQNKKLTPQSQLQMYRLQADYPIMSLFQYGLSHITAKNIFREFQKHLSQRTRDNKNRQKILSPQQLQQLSMSSSIKSLFPYQFQQSGIKYLSQTIGLDQQYIHDFIMPVIWGSYLHEPNSITSMLKLLPLYCMQNKELGAGLGVLINQNQLYVKLVEQIKHVNIKHIYNHHLQQFKLLYNYHDNNNHNKNENQHQPNNNPLHNLYNQHYQIQATYLNTFVNQSKQYDQQPIIISSSKQQQSNTKQDIMDYHSIQTNLLFIIEDYQMVNKKEISYYRTVIDGKIKNDENYQQYYTLYFTYDNNNKQASSASSTKSSTDYSTGSSSNNNYNYNNNNYKNSKYIYSATRLCKDNCKNFNKNVYLLISKQKLTEKDLGMFQQHHIIYYKKYWLPKTQLPSTKKFQEISNVFRVYDTQAISDSFQFKLHVLDQLSQVVVGRIEQQ